MDIVWIILGTILIIAGLIGCILPIIPGPPLSYFGLLVLQFKSDPPFNARFLIIWALIVLVVTVLDYVIPSIGVQRYGGSRKGIWGASIGVLAGLFIFPPFGIVAGPVIGAVIGELLAGKNTNNAFKAAVGSLMGLLTGVLLKLIVSSIMTYHFFAGISS